MCHEERHIDRLKSEDAIYPVQKASWNIEGVEPGNPEGPGCWDLGLFWY